MNAKFYNSLKRSILALAGLMAILSHPILVGQPTTQFDFGDAPEGYVAYPGLSPVIGWFPTCIYVGATGTYIQHGTGEGVTGGFFGMYKDNENDGNAGSCPSTPPNTIPPNMDECFNDMDAGLIKPGAYNITEFNGQGVVSTCPQSSGGKLGVICGTAIWGTDIDINVTGFSPPPGDPFPYVGYLNVLADWNQDGQWTTYTPCGGTAQVDERVLRNIEVPNYFNGPASMLNLLSQSGFQIGPNRGYVWFRFSITDFMLPEYWTGDGTFMNGETEDYLLFVTGTDFGDAPSPYPTTLAAGGAHHYIGKIKMGPDPQAWPDHESNGQPDPNAEGDDLAGIDDEDGVLLPPTFVPGQSAQVTVLVNGEYTGFPVSGKLSAWIDWNQNGVWDNNPMEFIINNQTVYEGANNFTVNVPQGATPGYTFARFRISSQNITSPNGPAPDGEVEDYRVMIENADIYDFGDAPEGSSAYPDLGVIGQFPTCMTSGLSGYVRNKVGNAFMGQSVNEEEDGNGGACPVFTPGLYNMDECQNDGDAGLSIAGAYTIYGNPGEEFVTNCLYSSGEPLGSVCTPAIWGQHLDMFVQNTTQNTVYVNVLFDWNRDGVWSGSVQCPFGPMVPEHVLVNHPVPAGYIGPLSGTIAPQPFLIGPVKGFYWARFSISEYPVSQNWDGSGELGIGETEDYLLKAIAAQNLNLLNISIPAGQSYCFEATQTITLAGDGSFFTVADGASATLVAGQNILMKEGTHCENGSTVHAYIDLTGLYCSPPPTKSATETAQEIIIPEEESFFRIWPNPTQGLFTLELTETGTVQNIRVEIYSVMGKRIMAAELPVMKQYRLDLSDRQPGLYLIKVWKGNESGYSKLIRL